MRQISCDLRRRACLETEYAAEKDRERVFEVSHINRSVERRRENTHVERENCF